MGDCYKKNLDDVILEFCINGRSSKDNDWVDVDIKIESPVITYNLKDWERDGELFLREDLRDVTRVMNKWLRNELESDVEYESVEPDLLLKLYVEERKIDFCICLQTKDLSFSENYIILPLVDQDAEEFAEYWVKADKRVNG